MFIKIFIVMATFTARVTAQTIIIAKLSIMVRKN